MFPIMKLIDYIKTEKLKPFVFSKRHKIPNAVMARALKGESISLLNFYKINKACFGKVPITEFLPPDIQ